MGTFTLCIKLGVNFRSLRLWSRGFKQTGGTSRRRMIPSDQQAGESFLGTGNSESLLLPLAASEKITEQGGKLPVHKQKTG